MPGQRSGLGPDAFHQVAVAAQGVDVVVEQIEAGAVVAGGQPALGDRHADAVADALPQRPGRRLHAAGVAVLGMSGATAVQLAEAADVVQRHGRLVGAATGGVGLLHAAQVQRRIEQHRGVTAGKHEAVAIGPERLGRIVTQELVEEHIGRRRQGHGRARMAAIGRLHGVHREGANGIDGERFDRLHRGRRSGGRSETAGRRKILTNGQSRTRLPRNAANCQ